MMLVLKIACIGSMISSSRGITLPPLPDPCPKDLAPWSVTNSLRCSALANYSKWSLKFPHCCVPLFIIVSAIKVLVPPYRVFTHLPLPIEEWFVLDLLKNPMNWFLECLIYQHSIRTQILPPQFLSWSLLAPFRSHISYIMEGNWCLSPVLQSIILQPFVFLY